MQTPNTARSEESEGNAVTDFDLAELVNGVDIDELFMSSRKQKELDHAEEAAAAGRAVGCFGSLDGTVGASVSSEVVAADDALRSNGIHVPIANDENHGDIGEIATQDPNATPASPAIIYEGDVDLSPTAIEVDVSMLSPDQLRAFKIVRDHLTHRGAGGDPPQLLMQIQGEGGTGKSVVRPTLGLRRH